jgi:transcriptional regulator with XRE-family HTH domain
MTRTILAVAITALLLSSCKKTCHDGDADACRVDCEERGDPDACFKQAELAELAQATDATISRIERGRLAPSQDLLRRLADGVGATEADLLARSSSPKKPTLRQAEARLLAAVRGWDEPAIDDLVRGIKLIAAAVVRSEGPPGRPTSRPGRARR